MTTPKLADLMPRGMLPARCRLHLVCGPPGSGKSTHVAERRAADDQVIDLDEIMAELAGAPLYQADPTVWLPLAIQERNARLAGLHTGDPDRTVWFIVCAAGGARLWWRNALRPASIKLLAVPAHECVTRIDTDPRRPPSARARHRDAVAEWWHKESLHLHQTLNRAAQSRDW